MPRWRFGERLDDVIEDACRRYADRTAVAIEGADIAYRELDARANQMARLFIQHAASSRATASRCCSTAGSRAMSRCSRC